jgi:hypothetical protein
VPLALCCVNGACCIKKTEITKGALRKPFHLSARFCTPTTLCLLTLHLSGLAGQHPSMAAAVITDGISKRESGWPGVPRERKHTNTPFLMHFAVMRERAGEKCDCCHTTCRFPRAAKGGGSFVCARESKSKSLGRGDESVSPLALLAPVNTHARNPNFIC